MNITKDNIQFLPIPTHFNFKNLTDQRYGRLTVIGFAGRDGLKTFWFCECDCGIIKRIHAALLGVRTQSCGCLRVETSTRLSTTHGMRHTLEYNSYAKAKDRCNNPNDKRWKDYGGRGIEFRFNSFQEFFAEVGFRPTKKHVIDRIKVNGHYEVGNVKWSTHQESARHTRKNRHLTCNGKTQLLIEWAEELGISSATILYRLKRGWSEERALSDPLCRITFQGHTLSRAEWSRRLGFPPHTLFNRLKLGWSEEKALTTPIRKPKTNSSEST